MDFPEFDYPTLYKLQIFLTRLEKDPSVLDESGYSDTVKNALKWFVQRKVAESSVSDNKLEELDVEEEVRKLYNDATAMRASQNEMDVRERLSFNNSRMTLLKEILNMFERSKRVTEIGQFVKYVNSILTEEQKQKILDEFQNTY